MGLRGWKVGRHEMWFGETGMVGDVSAKPDSGAAGRGRLFKTLWQVKGKMPRVVWAWVLLGFACFGPFKKRCR